MGYSFPGLGCDTSNKTGQFFSEKPSRGSCSIERFHPAGIFGHHISIMAYWAAAGDKRVGKWQRRRDKGVFLVGGHNSIRKETCM